MEAASFKKVEAEALHAEAEAVKNSPLPQHWFSLRVRWLYSPRLRVLCLRAMCTLVYGIVSCCCTYGLAWLLACFGRSHARTRMYARAKTLNHHHHHHHHHHHSHRHIGAQMMTKKRLCAIKGLSEAKVEKIKEAVAKMFAGGAFCTALQVRFSQIRSCNMVSN